LAILLLGVSAWNILSGLVAAGAPSEPKEMRDYFLKLCDRTVVEFNKELKGWKEAKDSDTTPHHMPFFEDSYGIRPLCVAYDMTGNKAYLDACMHCADQIVAYQDRMTPKGAYYIGYERLPGAKTGLWTVADSGSIGMGVLATAIRTTDAQKKARYFKSLRSFARLVIDNYVRPGGGITDGIYPSWEKEMWCAVEIFGSLMFLAHDETKDPEYLKVALGALDWMNRHDIRKPDRGYMWPMYSGVAFYTGEFYAIALKYLPPGDPRRKASAEQIAALVQWLKDNQRGQGAKLGGAKGNVDYLEGTHMAGVPYVQLIFARELPEYATQAAIADKEMEIFFGLIEATNGKDPRPMAERKKESVRVVNWELTTFALMSYAEKLYPGVLFRTSHARLPPVSTTASECK
jgi:hypothetical protein